LESVGECHPVLAGQLVVGEEQHDVEDPLALGNRGGQGKGEHLMTVVAQRAGEPETKGRVIVDEQNRDIAAGRGRKSGSRRGRRG
jgi:hypothetical protein